MPEPLPKTFTLKIKVIPGSSKDHLAGWMDNGFFKVKLQAPPEDGKANKALLTLLSRSLGIAKSNIIIERGKTSPEKTVKIIGLDEAKIRMLFDSYRK